MKSLVLRNIDIRLLQSQKDILIKSLSLDCLTNELRDTLEGVLNLFDYITDADWDSRTLDGHEVDSIVVDLKVLLAICARNDISSQAHDLALARAIYFLECKTFPVGGE
jgi:hypothetical protein